MSTVEEIQSFSDLRRDGPVFLQLAGVSRCDGTYRIHRTPLAMTVIEYVEHGHGYLTVNGKKFFPAAGCVYIVPSWSAHEYGSSSSDPWVKHFFNLSGPLPDSLYKSYEIEDLVLFPNALAAGRLIMSGVEALKRIPRENIQKFIERRLLAIVQSLADMNLHNKRTYSDMTEAILKFLRSKVLKPMPELSEIAASAGRSETQTIRVFKKETGMTPYHFLLKEKMNAACGILTGTDKSVRDTAAMFGFHDEYYFSRVFRQFHGVSPRDYRLRGGTLPPPRGKPEFRQE